MLLVRLSCMYRQMQWRHKVALSIFSSSVKWLGQTWVSLAWLTKRFLHKKNSPFFRICRMTNNFRTKVIERSEKQMLQMINWCRMHICTIPTGVVYNLHDTSLQFVLFFVTKFVKRYQVRHYVMRKMQKQAGLLTCIFEGHKQSTIDLHLYCEGRIPTTLEM